MKFKTLACLFPGLGRELTERENWAVTWAKQHHNWRKKYSESYEDHMARCPKYQDRIIWGEWYSYPCGDNGFNENVQIVRGLFVEAAEKKGAKVH